ncbi:MULTISPECIES: MarR family transcriptional regulator [unclassified Acidocella]|uniref:MarR family transcriptional regulator n=1 Tax=unclassified Acidocella TaxID=2648610 RepID=UPI00028E4ABC|nr:MULTISPECIES: MarR family transcriptional regulator [unclassified Acidocella]EKN01087.1 MarR family transcriptional regulator [Acidocella sp. MX-AZ02]WBO60586.1 MarR family transcriptional regulator [Acidocella sp. MX-AZ03]
MSGSVEPFPISGALAFLLRTGKDSLTTRQLSVIMACRDSTQTERGLASELGVSKPAITRAADRLTEEGLLHRELDMNDRRSVNLVLSAAGRKFAANFV